ncbi:PD-(D/E)XK nuclease family protein [Flavobacterium amniphilum]|uniref:PD-(D/E)XK nuclease family protein n=1 Tax=Flavobacterium amniphilum TaxID=1834035 RepID=UPI002029CF17|nr:PD-(D/E)XK nuclease family protein [Flavobacterium amniphilum]MCL9806000.1 PD-(D/E)XK nuclease family protein [Flavobacterium amniphilum]
MQDNSFLDKLTSYILKKYPDQLSDVTIVLPNKRARVFLLDVFRDKVDNPFFAPECISIEEFIHDLSGIRSVDSIELLFEFYEVYTSLTEKSECQSFEKFANWAKILIQDFNEIDRYLLEPNYVFSYLKDIEVLKRWELNQEDRTELIDKQLEFWNKLPDYYESFYNNLLAKGIGYQGLVYREAVNNLEFFSSNLKSGKLIFAGFNALNQAEEKIIQHLLAIEKAEILWDIDEVFINDPLHDTGLFVRRFKEKWVHYKANPFEWIVNEFSQDKKIEIIGTSKSIGQAKIASSILHDLITGQDEVRLDNVALVLGDENLLIPVLHSLPENVGSLNITMGYSSKNNPVQVLISKLFKMHGNALNRSQESYVMYYKDVLDVLSNPVIESFVNVSELVSTIKRNNYTFITHQKVMDLQSDHNVLFGLLFEKWNCKPIEILELISQTLLLIKQNLANNSEDDKLVKTFLYSVFKVVNKMISYCSKNDYVDSIEVLHSIYKQVIDVAEVSFEGEPLSGLQIMGVLESRVLDFETVIVTSMNEGKFPAGKSVNSFIPYDVKKEIGLPTFKEKDAIYTYHFYHLLQRAKNIFLLYNTESEGLDGGEKSRFITQLEVEKKPNHNIIHKIIQPHVPNIAYEKLSIPKSASVLERLKAIAVDTEKGFSPSALTTYVRNPIQFYFQRVLSIREVEEVEENIALNTLGTIIHETLEELYKPVLNKFLSVTDIVQMQSLADEEIFNQFKLVYKEGEVKKGKNLLAFEVAKRNIHNFLKEEKRLIDGGDVVKVLDLEKRLFRELIDDRLHFPVVIGGSVDRIEIRNGKMRIIDYKTGKVEARSLVISDWNGLTQDIKNEKIIQLLCYAFMCQESVNGMEIEAGIISFKNMKAGFMPFGFKEGKEISSSVTPGILDDFKTQLIGLINEILSPEIPFEEKGN